MSSHVLDDSGNGVAGVYVYAELQGSPWLAGHAGKVETEVRGYTDTAGRWVLDLAPAADLEDSDSWWLVRVYQHGSFGVDVPAQPVGDALVDIAGYLRPLGPPPDHAEQYILASRLGVPGGVATLGSDGDLTTDQRPVREYVQASPASVWGPIAHNLGRYPVAWSLYDSTGRECDEYTVQHLDLNTSRVSMDEPTAGLIRMI